MTGSVDLSVEMAGLSFKSPVVVASSECGSDVSILRHLTEKKIGGIVTKSEEKYPYTMPPDCPYAPVIDTELCTLCGTCATTCIYRVFTVDENQSKVFIDENKCWSCGFCVGICPAGAIELRDRRNKARLIWNNQGSAESFQISFR
jgi:ferredoxin